VAGLTGLEPAASCATGKVAQNLNACYGVAYEFPKPACTLATLDGLYIVDATGYNIVPGNPVPVPKTVVEFLTFNGDGTLTGIATVVAGGALRGPEFLPATGTYTVNSDCTGKLFSGGITFDLFIASHEGRLHMIQVEPGMMLAGEAKRVSR